MLNHEHTGEKACPTAASSVRATTKKSARQYNAQKLVKMLNPVIQRYGEYQLPTTQQHTRMRSWTSSEAKDADSTLGEQSRGSF